MRTLYFCPVVSIFLFFPHLISAVADWMSTIFRHMVCLSTNLECRSEMCCTRLAGNTGRKKSPSAHRRTTLPGYIVATKAGLDNGKNLLNSNISLHMFSQYGELRATSGWDMLASLGYPCKFQPVLHLGSVMTWHSTSGRQANFVALNRRRHLYSTGRPTRWASAHILVLNK